MAGFFGLIFWAGELLAEWSEAVQTGILYILQTLLLLAPMIWFTRIKYGSGWRDFGLRKVAVRKLLKSVGMGFAIYYAVNAVILGIQATYEVKLPGYGEQASHVPLFGDSVWGIVLGFVLIVGVAPFAEELFFRGYLYRVFRKFASVRWAGPAAAALFALFHIEFAVFLPLFVLGLILNHLYERTGSLWTPIVFHMVNNTLAFGMEVALAVHPDLFKL